MRTDEKFGGREEKKIPPAQHWARDWRALKKESRDFLLVFTPAASPPPRPLAPDFLPPRDRRAVCLAVRDVLPAVCCRRAALPPTLSPPSNAPPSLRRCGLPSCHRSLPCRSFLRAAPPLPFSLPYPLPSVTAVPPYRRSQGAAPAVPYVPPSDVLPVVCCRRVALPPTLTVPRRLYTHTLLSARPSLR